MTRPIPSINPLLARAALSAVNALVEATQGVQTAVVATSDGIVVASRSATSFDESKLAAMSSSIAAIGSVVTEETSVGECRSIMVDAANGCTVILSIPSPDWPMILCVIATKSAVLGQVIYAAREAAATIARAAE